MDKWPGESWDNIRCLVPFDQNIPLATVTRAPARPERGRALGRPAHEEDQSCVQPKQAPTAGCAELFSGPVDFTVDKKSALALEGCVGSSTDRLGEEVTVVGLRASGDVVAPKDSLLVENWSLRKNESGK